MIFFVSLVNFWFNIFFKIGLIAFDYCLKQFLRLYATHSLDIKHVKSTLISDKNPKDPQPKFNKRNEEKCILVFLYTYVFVFIDFLKRHFNLMWISVVVADLYLYKINV